MGSIAVVTPTRSYGAAMLSKLKASKFPPFMDADTWSKDFDHRSRVINELANVFKKILPEAIYVERILFCLSNSDLVNLACHLSPSRSLEHIIRVGILCRHEKMQCRLNVDSATRIFSMSVSDAELKVREIDANFRKYLPALLSKLNSLEVTDKKLMDKVMDLLQNKSPVEFEIYCSTHDIPEKQHLRIKGHFNTYALNVLSLHERVQFTLDKTVWNHYYENQERKNTLFDFLDRTQVLGRDHAKIFLIEQLLKNIELYQEVVCVEIDKSKETEDENIQVKAFPVKFDAPSVQSNRSEIYPDQEQKYTYIPNLDQLVLNLRLSLMVSSGYNRKFLAEASEEEILSIAADTLEGLSKVPPKEIEGSDRVPRLVNPPLTLEDAVEENPDGEEDFDRDEAIETLVEAGHKKAKLKKMDDDELIRMLLELEDES